jgi:hypothetical protein
MMRRPSPERRAPPAPRSFSGNGVTQEIADLAFRSTVVRFFVLRIARCAIC